MVGMKPVSTLVPYIRGGADGSYIDTGITPDSTTQVIVWARNWNPSTSNNMLFGYMDSSNNTNGFSLATWATASTGRIGVYYGVYNNPYVIVDDAFKYLSGYHKYELNAGVFKVDDVTLATAPSTTISTNGTIHLFGRNTGGTHNNTASPIDICACKIYKDGVLVRDYTPVSSPSVGFYDSVSDTVFTNDGTGSFSYGEFNPDAYTQLEYISTNGAAYFDSGIYGGNSLNYVCKFKTEINGRKTYWPTLFGCQTTSSSKRYMLIFGPSNSSTINQCAYCNYSSTLVYRSFVDGTPYVCVKDGNTFTLYTGNTQKNQQTAANYTYTTDYTIYVGANNAAGTVGDFYHGRIHYIGFGTQRNYVPAKVNDVAGMYDTYHDVFYPSATSTPFVAGPTI